MANPTSRHPAAILFDLDGTLVDSLPDIGRAVNLMLSAVGRRTASLEEMRYWMGDGTTVLIERSLKATGGLPEESLSGLVDRYIGYYRGHTVIETRPFPGVEAALRKLKAAGYRLGVCTNKPTDLSNELLEGVGLASMFSAVVGGDSVPARKPAAGHVLATLEAVGGFRDEAMMVGDSGNDVAAARAAGLPVVVVGYGYTRIAPAELGADAVLQDFGELPDLVARFI
jgi:phosphoglycolate phosphatase